MRHVDDIRNVSDVTIIGDVLIAGGDVTIISDVMTVDDDVTVIDDVIARFRASQAATVSHVFSAGARMARFLADNQTQKFRPACGREKNLEQKVVGKNRNQ